MANHYHPQHRSHSNNHPNHNPQYHRLMAMMELQNKERTLMEQIAEAEKYLQSLKLPLLVALCFPLQRRSFMLRKQLVKTDLIKLKNDLASIQAHINSF